MATSAFVRDGSSGVHLRPQEKQIGALSAGGNIRACVRLEIIDRGEGCRKPREYSVDIAHTYDNSVIIADARLVEKTAGTGGTPIGTSATTMIAGVDSRTSSTGAHGHKVIGAAQAMLTSRFSNEVTIHGASDSNAATKFIFGGNVSGSTDEHGEEEADASVDLDGDLDL